jgi:hypothetical protein
MRIARLIIPIIFFVMSVVFLIMLGPMGGSVTFKDNFQKGIKSAWSPKTPDKWELAEEGKNKFYRLKEPGEPDNKVTRPNEYSLVKDIVYTDFTLKCKIRCDASTTQRYRDAVIIFDYQDDTHFCYVHLSNISDDLHNAIMLVNGDYRQKLNPNFPPPTLTDVNFHDVELKRRIEGDIEVYFDGEMVMRAHDTTLRNGLVGVGSSDDIASFDDFRVRGLVLEDDD